MDLWRLERLRLTRTNRLWIVLGVYAFFGVLGPFTARYLAEILRSLGGMELAGLELPVATPADGITQFTSNAGQLGLLAVVVVAAGAIAIDARPEFGIYLRTRSTSLWQLLLPRVVTAGAAAVLALVTGTAIATVVTGLLIGPVDLVPLIVGTAYGALYLLFVVSLTAAVAGRASSVLTTVLGTVATLIALPILSLVPALERWVPSELLGAVDLTIRGAPLAEALPAATTAVIGSAALLWVGVRAFATREL